MHRTDVNPWEWSKAFGFSQAVEMRGAERILVCSGQTAIGEDGSPPSSSKMGDQVKKAFENLGEVLQAAGLGASDVVKVNYYTTDVDIGYRARTTCVGVLRRHSPGFDSSRCSSAGLSTAQDRDRSHGNALNPIDRRRPTSDTGR